MAPSYILAVEAHRDLRRAYYCLRCTKETLRPERLRYRSESLILCSFCSHGELYWGTWDSFLRACAKQAKESAAQDVGKIVGKLIARSRN